ncbi:zonular occludens toxin domain-containing protein [Pokkaliibacter sp. MBI-7]|uniref:zonular occludens toxin domain-containing protein n=1 Tax=Pokkaliibacter sp. MBI-7 TaxID=3040600 RepID=UPI002449918A|nr:zonular occludens toxin domain-containing protein [Pokkaliibacter sp. MBI-7]MDH2435391.1 zonular occludens toxin domain-containing protein [Pokkaliibacter sp. MBI-7]MDH2435398.1 zonular occludens toxin domain-containing protein [Pokkaliibacter sp. MBI-7]MDH2435405.1 zonular occludens toxin domain-containing protein [Pokkaliibacter sp. MBI-7]
MAVYFITGKLGAGKSIQAVDQIQQRIKSGRRVATNMDLFLDELMPPDSAQSVARIPDKPRLEDLDNLGLGYEGDFFDEKKFGLLVLDECASFLNVRKWNDKERAGVIDWFIHARKKRWDIIFLVQAPNVIDRQVFEALCEHIGYCKRIDRVPLFRFIRLPQVHVCNVYYGESKSDGIKVDTWSYTGDWLHRGYDTAQCFVDGLEYLPGHADPVDMRAPYTMLSAWHLKGRYLQKTESKPFRIPGPFKILAWLAFGIYAVLTEQAAVDVARRCGMYRGQRR